jgi:hypothetical protein
VPGYTLENIAFIVTASLSSYNFYRAVVLDPGRPRLPDNDAETKDVRVFFPPSSSSPRFPEIA